MRLGLLVNPVAGLGGPAGLKGSDEAAWRHAIAQGYQPTAPERARRFVAECGPGHTWVTVPGAMGQACMPHGQASEVVLPDRAFELGKTTPQDTAAAAQALAQAKVDLLCFLGGDGTATAVAQAVGTRIPCLGVPAGVKITSPVFAHDVEEAAWLVRHLGDRFETIERDVTDIDEEAYRGGRVDVRLTGSLRVPLSPAVQGGKVATSAQTPMAPLVEQVLRDWDAQALHLVGAGSVCQAVKSQFWGKPTLLGVDEIDGNRIVRQDLNDRAIQEVLDAAQAAGRRVKLVLSPIGGQGMLLGRGTQMLRPDLLRRIGWDNLTVIAPPEKLMGLRGLWIDSGDPQLDAQAPRHVRVVTGWNETRMLRLLHGEADGNGRAPGTSGNGGQPPREGGAASP